MTRSLSRDVLELMRAAHEVAARAHSPYSGIRVGAALLCADGGIVVGCNVESASYGLTQCAERAALTAAVALGQREFRALAVWASTPRVLMPCGACRQVLAEHEPELAVRCGCGWLAREARPRSVVRSNLRRLLPGVVSERDVRSGGRTGR